MKKIMIGFIFIISNLVVNAQKTITYEEMKTISKGMFESIDCDNYVAKDAHTYKVGDTIKIGRPSSNKSFVLYKFFLKSSNTLTNGVLRISFFITFYQLKWIFPIKFISCPHVYKTNHAFIL